MRKLKIYNVTLNVDTPNTSEFIVLASTPNEAIDKVANKYCVDLTESTLQAWYLDEFLKKDGLVAL